MFISHYTLSLAKNWRKDLASRALTFVWFIGFTALIRDYCIKLFCLPSVCRLLQADAPLTAQHCWVTGLWPFSSCTHGATCEASPSLAESSATWDQEEQAYDCALSCTVPFPLTGVTGSLLLLWETSLKYLPIVQLNQECDLFWLVVFGIFHKPFG